MARFALPTTTPTTTLLGCKLERNPAGGFMLKARSVAHYKPIEANATEAARLLGLQVEGREVLVGSRYAMIAVSAEDAAGSPLLAELVKVLELEDAAKAAAATAALAEERTAFTLYDYRFELVAIPAESEADAQEGQGWKIMGSDWTDALGTVHETFRPDVEAWAFEAGGLSRDDRDRVRAAVKLLANLI